MTRATINYSNAFFVNHMFSYGLSEGTAAVMFSIPQISCKCFFLIFYFYLDILTIMILPRLINSEANDKFLNSLSLLVSIIGVIFLSPAWKPNL